MGGSGESTFAAKLVEQVALNAWKRGGDNAVCLHLRSSRHLNNRGAQQKLAEALSTFKGSTVELTIVEDDNPAVRTRPLEWRQAIYEEKLAQARESIIADNIPDPASILRCGAGGKYPPHLIVSTAYVRHP